jgi:hypothetical protein
MGLRSDACQPLKYLSVLAINGEKAESLSFSFDRGSPKYVWGKEPTWHS